MNGLHGGSVLLFSKLIFKIIKQHVDLNITCHLTFIYNLSQWFQWYCPCQENKKCWALGQGPRSNLMEPPLTSDSQGGDSQPQHEGQQRTKKEIAVYWNMLQFCSFSLPFPITSQPCWHRHTQMHAPTGECRHSFLGLSLKHFYLSPWKHHTATIYLAINVSKATKRHFGFCLWNSHPLIFKVTQHKLLGGEGWLGGRQQQGSALSAWRAAGAWW